MFRTTIYCAVQSHTVSTLYSPSRVETYSLLLLLPVSVSYALRPAVGDVDLHVPAVCGLVRLIGRKVLSEPHTLGVHAALLSTADIGTAAEMR